MPPNCASTADTPSPAASTAAKVARTCRRAIRTALVRAAAAAPESRLVNTGIAAQKGRAGVDERSALVKSALRAGLNFGADQLEIFHQDRAGISGLLLARLVAALAHVGEFAARPPERAAALLRDRQHLFRRRREIALDHAARGRRDARGEKLRFGGAAVPGRQRVRGEELIHRRQP